MAAGSRGYDDQKAWWKFDDHLKIPEYDVPAFVMVVVAKRPDRTPPERQICEVNVRKRDCLRAEVECCARKNAVLKDSLQRAVGR